ncbi:MAG: class I SAM-dependent methyltransferase, partial [Gemmatimonadaceae bacterium]|nr:class I SAM-dependent methyltransferase [Gemmatimonadaceae bacterium]
MSAADFTDVTELPGDAASDEELRRLYTRYYWAGDLVRGGDVLEVGCGAGQGLGYLASLARTVVGGDVSATILNIARKHYGERIPLEQFDAEHIPFADGSFDALIIFEAIYYLKDAAPFLREAHRVLRPGGRLLITTANKDLFDFTPSPHS